MSVQCVCQWNACLGDNRLFVFCYYYPNLCILIKNNQISQAVTSMCNFMLNAGNAETEWDRCTSKKSIRKKWLILTDNGQTVKKYRKKHFFGLAEKNCCTKQDKNSKYSNNDTDILSKYQSKQYKDIQYNERHTYLSDSKIVSTYHFRIRHLGSSTRALIAGAQKIEQFSLHKGKAESLSKNTKLNSLEFTKRMFKKNIRRLTEETLQ